MSDREPLDGLRLRPAGPADGDGIRALLADASQTNPKTDRDVMQWQYWDNPFGETYSWVYEVDGRIVCHFATIAVPVVMGDERGIAFVGVDGATAQEYRGRGVFAKIIEEAIAFGALTPVPITIYFRAAETRLPSAADAPNSALDLYVRPLRPDWLAARLKLPGLVGRALLASVLRPPRTPRGAEVDGPPADVDELWASTVERYPYSIWKDGDWWAWRFGARPSSTYRFFEARDGGVLSGAAVAMPTSADERLVYILELLAVDDAAAKMLVASMVEGFPGVDALVFRASPASYSCRIARSAGLVKVPPRFDVRPPRMAVFPHPDTFIELAQAPWSVTWGDMDHL